MRNKIISLIAKLITIGTIYFVLFFVIFGLARVDGNDMYPNINNGDLALYFHFDKECTPGDVAVVDAGKKNLYMRIVACGGDTVAIKDKDSILINGLELDVSREYSGKFMDENGEILAEMEFPYTVPVDQYFLLSDNRAEVSDSRYVGAFTKKQIKGKVISILRTRGM